MPFQKGEGGRPKGVGNRVKSDAYAAFVKLGGPNGIKYAQQLHALATGTHDDPQVRIKALAVIAPYIWGKPTEHIEHSGELSLPVKVTFELHP